MRFPDLRPDCSQKHFDFQDYKLSPIELLKERIAQLESERRFDNEPYPKNLIPFNGFLTGQGFFPGGDGLWRDDPTKSASTHPFPVGGVLVLGNDFGCADCEATKSPGFKQCVDRGYEDPPTWKIKDLLTASGIPKTELFFTNAYLGLRCSSKSTGPNPGLKDSRFLQFCREFFDYQLTIHRPRLIICLGHEPRKFLASSKKSTTPPLVESIRCWQVIPSFKAFDQKCAPIMNCNTRLSDNSVLTVTITVITHPSFARSNYAQNPRTYKDKIGEAAEIAILSEAWTSATQ